MHKSSYNIAFSCAGGKYIVQNILSLRMIKDKNFKIFGVDQKSISRTNLDFLNEFSLCPSANDDKEEYKSFIINYCKINRIDIFFPLSETEIDLLLNIDLSSLDTIFILPKKLFAKIASDKYDFLKKLLDNNIINDKFYKIDSVEEFNKIVSSSALGYTKIVCKPRMSSGSRGVLVIDNTADFLEPVPNRICAIGNKDSIFNYIKFNKLNLNNYILTEYFGDDVYDVDSYCVNGDIHYLVCRQRQYLNPFSPVNEGCKIKKNIMIEDLIKKVSKKLNITGVLDLDIAIDKNNIPHIIDVSPRISGSVSCTTVAGLNIFEVIINHVLHNKFRPQKINREYILRPVNIYSEVIK